MKLKAFFIIFEGLSLKQIKHRGESLTLTIETICLWTAQDGMKIPPITKPLISPPKQILSNEGIISVLDSYHVRLLNAFYFT